MTRFIRLMSGCSGFSLSSSCESAARAASSCCVAVAPARGLSPEPDAPIADGQQGGAPHGLGVRARVGEEALEHQLAIAVPRSRLDEGLQLHLGRLNRLHVGVELRGQTSGVPLAELLQFRFLLFEPGPRFEQLGAEEVVRRIGEESRDRGGSPR